MGPGKSACQTCKARIINLKKESEAMSTCIECLHVVRARINEQEKGPDSFGEAAASQECASCGACKRVLERVHFSATQFKRWDNTKRRCKGCVTEVQPKPLRLSSLKMESSLKPTRDTGGSNKAGRRERRKRKLQGARLSLNEACETKNMLSLAAEKKVGEAGATGHSQGGAEVSKHQPSGVTVRKGNWGFLEYVDRVMQMKCFPDLVRLQLFPNAKDISESMGALQGAGFHSTILRSCSSSTSPPSVSSSSRASFPAPTSTCPSPRPIAGGSTRTRRDAGGGAWALEGVLLIAVGDGCSPRTAGLAAFLTKWHAVSIDPEMKQEWVGPNPKGVRRLHGFKGTLAQWVEGLPGSAGVLPASLKALVVVGVHSHHTFTGVATVEKLRVLFGNVATNITSLPCCPGFRPEKDIGRPPDVVYEDYCIFSEKRKVEIWNWPAA